MKAKHNSLFFLLSCLKFLLVFLVFLLVLLQSLAKMEMNPQDRGLGTVQHLRIEPLGGNTVRWNICHGTQWGRFVGYTETLDTGGGAPPNPRPIQEQMILDVKLPLHQLKSLVFDPEDLFESNDDSGDSSGGGSSHPLEHDGNGSGHVPTRSRDRSSDKNQDGTSEDTSAAALARTEGSVGHVPVSPLGEANPPTYSPLPRPFDSESEDIIWLSEYLSDEEIEEESEESIDSWATSDLTSDTMPRPDLAGLNFDWVPVTRVPPLHTSLPGLGGSTWSCP